MLFKSKIGRFYEFVVYTLMLFALCVLFILWASTDKERTEQERLESLTTMTELTGIVNNESYDLVLASSISERTEINGTFILFAGSIGSSANDTLRIGYTSPDGLASILSVPIDKIKIDVASKKHGGSFEFDRYRTHDTFGRSLDLQGNIEGGYFTGLVLHVTQDEYHHLVSG